MKNNTLQQDLWNQTVQVRDNKLWVMTEFDVVFFIENVKTWEYSLCARDIRILKQSGVMRSYFNAFFDKEADAIYVTGGTETKNRLRVKTA